MRYVLAQSTSPDQTLAWPDPWDTHIDPSTVGRYMYSQLGLRGHKVELYRHLNLITTMYSGPYLSGHSQQRPPSLMWPQIFATATMNVFILPKGHLSNVATIFLASRVALLERDYCNRSSIHHSACEFTILLAIYWYINCTEFKNTMATCNRGHPP